MSRHRKALEAQLTPQQRRAAQLTVDNEWAELLTEDGKKRPQQDIADDLGIARSTLYEWKAMEAFVDYINYLADKQLESMRSEVNVAIMKSIRGGANGIPSVKALELYMRRWGLLTDRSVVEDKREATESRRKTDEEIRSDIDALNDLVNGAKS
ncbi:phBC6A51 family helix-turn-helix protein [Paenibacillus taiwanensis]|uniref:phBC6A51 family helix-turn-helix protein n=1 Tax=Paenibacillus taiwanensis TaxID=401638 RepID=UPI000418D248|nr:phBC6A51 family helix-turn-helix protein [Paenibacillus taiwanensis]